MNTIKTTTLLEVSLVNIENTFSKIKEYADQKGYRIIGDLKTPTTILGFKKSPSFDSKNQMKVVRYYINRLDKKVGMRMANQFLHFLFKKIYKLDCTPSVDLSEKEVKIQSARKKWKQLQADCEKARIEYRSEKGDFYKIK